MPLVARLAHPDDLAHFTVYAELSLHKLPYFPLAVAGCSPSLAVNEDSLAAKRGFRQVSATTVRQIAEEHNFARCCFYPA
jgi:hypothetical protein